MPDDIDPALLDSIELELLRLDRTQAGKHRVAEGAGGVDGARLDEGYGQALPLQFSGACGPSKTTSDNDNPWRGLGSRPAGECSGVHPRLPFSEAFFGSGLETCQPLKAAD